MNKKKILVLAMTLSMVAILALGATLAYFTDTDSDVNTMTLGSVNIIQNEKDQEGKDFQDQPLLPMVDGRGDNDPVVDTDGFFNDKMGNVVDKIVTVTNEAEAGSENMDAYVRTLIAFETTDLLGGETVRDAHNVYIGVLGDFEYVTGTDPEEFTRITVDGVEYVLAVKVYEDALAAGATTEPSLKQVFMSPDAGNEIIDLFGNEYTILTLSQATQTAGFDGDAAAALNEAFGEVTAENAEAWFNAI